MALTAAVPARAASYSSASDPSPHLYFGGGPIYQNSGRVAVDSTGGTSVTGTNFVRLAMFAMLDLGDSWGLAPGVGYTPWGATGADTGEVSRLFNADLRLYARISSLDLHTGPGVLFSTVSGSGGSTTLNNGQSTAVFALPAGSSTSRYLYWELGAGAQFGRFRLDVDALVSDAFTARRAFYPMLTLSAGFY